MTPFNSAGTKGGQMIVCYISGALTGDGKRSTLYDNMHRARECAIKYYKLGYAVICPHLNSYLMFGSISEKEIMGSDLELVRRSDIIVMLPNWEQSKGAKLEHELAVKLHKDIVYEQF